MKCSFSMYFNIWDSDLAWKEEAAGDSATLKRWRMPCIDLQFYNCVTRKDHRIIHVAKDLRMSLVQLSDQAESVMRSDHVTQGFFQLCRKNVQGWEVHNPYTSCSFAWLFSDWKRFSFYTVWKFSLVSIHISCPLFSHYLLLWRAGIHLPDYHL